MFASRLIALLSLAVASSVNALEIKDVLDRTITLDAPAQRVILTEDRQFYIVSALAGENADDLIVGWRGDMKASDPYNHQQFIEHFDKLEQLPTLGRFGSDSYDIEKVVTLNPDVLVVNVTSAGNQPHQEVLSKLEKFGIQVVYIDFRHDIDTNIAKSYQILGDLIGKTANAQKLVEFRQTQIDKVASQLSALVQSDNKPSVFIERIAGYSEDCCLTFGNENFGKLVEQAGGKHIGSDFIDGVFGQLDPEQVIASNPQHIILTTADWSAYVPNGKWVPVGYGANLTEAKDKLNYYTDKISYRGTDAVSNKNIHAIWHGFYTSSFDFIALQHIANWLHGDELKGVDPDQTFAEFYQEFLPFAYQSGYAVSLKND